MKLFTSIYGLIAVANVISAFKISIDSYPEIFRRDDLDINKSDKEFEDTEMVITPGEKSEIPSNETKFYKELTEECRESLYKNYYNSECYITESFTMNNYEKLCKLIFSDKCKVMLDDPMSLIPECKNDKSIVNVLEVLKKEMKSFYINSCTLNGDGKLCPINEAVYKNQTIKFNAKSEECNYKSCYDSLKQYVEENYSQEAYDVLKLIYPTVGNFSSEINEDIRRTYMTILDSKNCTSRIKDDTDKSKVIGLKSGASTIKAMNSLIILFIVFILF